MKLIMMRGLPASGKSTRAAEIIANKSDYYRVNRDLLRKMLHTDIFSHQREKITVAAQEMLVAQLLQERKNVIVDDTNLGEKHVDMWKSVAEAFGATFEVVDMMKDVSFYDCIVRNQDRPNAVPEHVIRVMAMQYGYLPYSKIVVCDIDGTVSDPTHRLEYARGPKKDWKTFFSLLSKDGPRYEVYQAAIELADANKAALVFVSARPEDYRTETENWLREYGMEHACLLMRRRGDKRPDTEVKSEIYERYLKQYDIVRVFDDRPSVIRMWREKGLEVEDVGEGIEF